MDPKLQQDIDKVLADVPKFRFWQVEDVKRSNWIDRVMDFGVKNAELVGVDIQGDRAVVTMQFLNPRTMRMEETDRCVSVEAVQRVLQGHKFVEPEGRHVEDIDCWHWDEEFWDDGGAFHGPNNGKSDEWD